MPDSDNAVLAAPDFSIFTAGMTVDSDIYANTQRPVVRMIGSSTEQDLHRDTMTVTALNDMVQRAPNGLLIWLNHDYTVPDSLFGSLYEAPRINVQYGVTDLHIAVEVELDNPAAAKTFKYIQNGRRLGCSIGCSVEDYELVDSGLAKGTPGWDVPLVHVTHVRPVEWSVVGIPANQRSWVENAISGIWARSINDPTREEEAYRLAPVVKSLFPKDFDRVVKGLRTIGHNSSLLKHLESVSARPVPTQRIVWKPEAQKFYLLNSASDTAGRPLSAEETPRVMDTIRIKLFGEPPVTSASTAVTTKEGDSAPLDTTSGEAMIRQDLDETKGADDAAKQAQQARAAKYHIAVKEGGNVTKPGEWASVPDSQWGDPTNYRYPMPDKAHADNAASRWGDASNRSQYSSEEQAIIGRRIEKRQRSFGESSDKEKSMEPKLISDVVLESGAHLLTYDDGSEVMESVVLKDGGVYDTERVTVKAGQPKPPANEEEEEDEAANAGKENDEPDDDEDDEEGNVKKGMKKKPDDENADDDEDANGDDKEDNEDGEDDKDEDDAKKSGEAAETAAVTESDPVIEQKSLDAAPQATEVPTSASEKVVEVPLNIQTTLDPSKELLLNSYNQLGAALGIDPVTAEQLLNKAQAIADATNVKSLAKVIDDAADQLLRELGVPDDDEAVEKGVDAETLDLMQKRGAAISARNKKRLQMAHDVLADMSGGLHCADYVARATDAPAQMQREEEKEQKDGGDAIETKSFDINELEVKVNVDTSVLDALTKDFGRIAETIGNLDTKGVAAELATAKTEMALMRKSLEETQARAQAMNDMLSELTEGHGLGRPTKTFLMRTAPQAPALGVGEHMTKSAVTGADFSQVGTIEEAMEFTAVEYKPGIGMARKWPGGLAKGLRPTLSAAQMTGMTTTEIMAYYDGGEALVPMIEG